MPSKCSPRVSCSSNETATACAACTSTPTGAPRSCGQGRITGHTTAKAYPIFRLQRGVRCRPLLFIGDKLSPCAAPRGTCHELLDKPPPSMGSSCRCRSTVPGSLLPGWVPGASTKVWGQAGLKDARKHSALSESRAILRGWTLRTLRLTLSVANLLPAKGVGTVGTLPSEGSRPKQDRLCQGPGPILQAGTTASCTGGVPVTAVVPLIGWRTSPRASPSSS